MRLTQQQIQLIRDITNQIVGNACRVYIFGSRLDDNQRGGDIDLLIELNEVIDKPALLAAQLSARLSRAMYGRKVDVLINAPNLVRLPIHDIAFNEGQLL